MVQPASLRSLACLLALPLAGCTDDVWLARECDPVRDRDCMRAGEAGTPSPDLDAASMSPLDARSDELDATDDPAPPSDASDAAEAALPGIRWLYPDLRNASFELTEGAPGDVATLSLPTGTEIAPWFSCALIGAGQGVLTGVRAEDLVPTAELDSDGGLPLAITAADERIFIAMQYQVTLFPPSLLQELRTPLRAGEHYALRLDIRTGNPDARLALQVYGSNAGCSDTGAATLLATTDPITRTGWQTVCLRFQAPSDYQYFMLKESAELPVSGDRLFFDNLRMGTDCPP